MTVTKKIKTINNKIEQNKAQYDLDRQAAKISVLSSGNVGKYEFLISKNVLLEKVLLEKATAIKKFEYSPLGSELKKRTGLAKDQYRLFIDQINVINNNRENDVKAGDGAMADNDIKGEDSEILDNVYHSYVGDSYKDW